MLSSLSSHLSKATLRSSFFGFFLWAVFLVAGLLVGLSFFFFYQQEIESWQDALEKRELAQVRLQDQVLAGELKTVVSDLLFLVDQFAEHRVQQAADKERQVLDFFAEEILLFVEQKKLYDQIRFIDNSGMETIRVNLAREHAYLVPSDELQVPNTAFYFEAAKDLDKGEVFVSRFVLNAEQGRVDELGKPIISFASPLFGAREERQGILVLNFLGAGLIENFQRSSINSHRRVMLVNNKGYWLSGMEREGHNWGFMFPRGLNWTFDREYKTAWPRILQDIDGQFHTKHGLFTFRTFSPDAEVRKLTGQVMDTLDSPTRHSLLGDNWKIISFVPEHILAERKISLQSRIFGSYAVLLFFVLFACWYWLRTYVKKKNYQQELLAVNARFGRAVGLLEQQNSEIVLIRRMTDFLLTCKALDECWPVILQYAKQLFPDTHGGLYLFHEADKGFAKKAVWGEGDLLKDFFEEDECWALRRGKVYVSAEAEHKLACSHFNSPPKHGYFCFPVMPPGGTPGLLTVLPAGVLVGKENRAALRALALAFVEQIALVLANIYLRETLHDQAIRDSLTGLYNRQYMEESLARELARAVRQEVSVGIIMFDLDHFKDFNDIHGHDAGDLVLMELGKFLFTQTRKEDIACRYGAEKFILILPGSNAENTCRRAEMLRESVEDNLRISYHGKLLSGITISLGVSVCPQNGCDPQLLISFADLALDEAKKDGRNRVKVATNTTT